MHLVRADRRIRVVCVKERLVVTAAHDGKHIHRPLCGERRQQKVPLRLRDQAVAQRARCPKISSAMRIERARCGEELPAGSIASWKKAAFLAARRASASMVIKWYPIRRRRRC